MSKTLEELAKDYCGSIVSTDYVRGAARENWVDIQRRVAGEEREVYKAFLSGYQAAKDKYEVKLKEVSANWTFCCEDKARLLQELAAKEDKS